MVKDKIIRVKCPRGCDRGDVTTFWQMSNRVIHVFGYFLKPKGICTQAIYFKTFIIQKFGVLGG